nr:ATP-dependent DNA helicase [Scytonema sp. UIC 10036]
MRSQAGFPSWPHHLTMARLVARALRLGRSALIQVGAVSGYQGRYRTSFVASALMWPGSVIIVATQSVQQRLLRVEIPRLQQWFQVNKPIRTGDTWPSHDFQGLLLISPEAWLKGQLTSDKSFPAGIPTIIDGVDDLEDWARQQMAVSLEAHDWDELMLAYPSQAETIRASRVQLTHELFQHPANPYECYLLTLAEEEVLSRLYGALDSKDHKLGKLWQIQRTSRNSFLPLPLLPSSLGNYCRGRVCFLYNCALQLSERLETIWQRQPVVLVGTALEPETEAPLFRARLGLGELTCLKFSSDSQTEAIQLYVPYQFPLPNTPEFQAAFIHKVRTLVCLSATAPGLTVVIVGDVPLKAQVGAILAAEFGSRVQVEKTCLDEKGILVTGWEFWREHQKVLPAPQLLIVSTLPLPSLEHPLVSGRVSYYKRSHQDWFRLYLLPTALNELQRAIAPVRESKGVVALLDTRVILRSYGAQVLAALSPLARINYLDPSLFSPTQEEDSAC